MVFRIVIAGESQCEVFAEICLVADHLAKTLPQFCYERIEKSVMDWKPFLQKTNQKNKWHHTGSPLVWKEMLCKGSQPYYIGGGSEFLEYCHSYYEFDVFFSPEKFDGLTVNLAQYKEKLKVEAAQLTACDEKVKVIEKPTKTSFVVTISGAGNPLTMFIISGLLELGVEKKFISKIYITDDKCTNEFMKYVEKECSFIGTNLPSKVVKYVDKIGLAITHTDLLIILDHAPFDEDNSIGAWLHKNKKIMADIALKINASATRKMYVVFPNVGPACYNATVLMNLVNIDKNNIVVATSDLGLEIMTFAAEIAEVPVRNMFCPPVWGFVGINHLVDIRTTVHKYNAFEPYKRYTRVMNSSLIIGSLTPEFRTMEYLMYFDESLWSKVAQNKPTLSKDFVGIAKATAVVNLAKSWLFDRDAKEILNVGVRCNGAFGLTFNGIFSQPSRFVDGFWVPADDFLPPRDPQMSLKYLEQMAEFVIKLERTDLPKVIPFHPCVCPVKYYKKKQVY